MSTTTSDRQPLLVVLLFAGVLVVLPALVMSSGMVGAGPMAGGMWHDGMGPGGNGPGWLSPFGLIVPLLWLAVAVGAGYLVYRVLTGDDQPDDPALEELRRAYARGDLSEQEYESRRDRLERDREI